RLRDEGARVVGLDLSAAMLARASGLDRVRGSALRLPFASSAFDAVIAVEVLEHLPAGGVEEALEESRRGLKPGGRLAIVAQNAGALDAHGPWLPSLALKWIDRRRGLWMSPPESPVRETWFWPRALRDRLRVRFEDVRVEHLLSPDEARLRLFRGLPGLR